MAVLFDFDNLIHRPTGPYLRLGTKLLRGVRAVQDHIKPYAAQWQQANNEEINRDKPIWVVLGDSMAQGIGADRFDHSWAGYLREYLKAAGRDYRLINLSISGARIEDVLERQIPAMNQLGAKPALVTMMVGSNNLVRKKYRQMATSDFAQLLELLPRGAVVANLPGATVAAVNIDQQLQAKAASGDVVLVDMRRHGPRNWRGKLARDRFHPNELGYQAMAHTFARFMNLL